MSGGTPGLASWSGILCLDGDMGQPEFYRMGTAQTSRFRALWRFRGCLRTWSRSPWCASGLILATWESMLFMWARSLTPVAPCGLPLAVGCRRLWRLGYRRTAWTAGVGLGAVTVAGSLVAGLLGPVAIAACALVVSLPSWIAGWWLARRA